MLSKFINKLEVIIVGMIGIKIFESSWVMCWNGFSLWVVVLVVFDLVDLLIFVILINLV